MQSLKTINVAYSLNRGVKRRLFSTTRCCLNRGPYKILFFGSDEFSTASLKAIVDAPDVWKSIQVVVPDIKNIGRGGKKKKKGGAPTEYRSPLMQFAKRNEMDYVYVSQVRPSPGIPSEGEQAGSRTTGGGTSEGGSSQAESSAIAGPSKTKKPEEIWTLREPFHSFDKSHLLITSSFGLILPNNVLEKFDPINRLNVHPSVLPKYRGAAPIQWAIMNGDETTGISVQRLVERGKGVDTGDIVGVETDILIPRDATFPSLFMDLAPKGGALLVKTLREMIAGTSVAVPQDESKKSRAPKFTFESSVIDWEKHTAVDIEKMSRAFSYKYPVYTARADFKLLDPKLHTGGIPREISDTLRTYEPQEEITYGTAFRHYNPDGEQSAYIACKPVDQGKRFSWLVVNWVKKGSKGILPMKQFWGNLKRDLNKIGQFTKL